MTVYWANDILLNYAKIWCSVNWICWYILFVGKCKPVISAFWRRWVGHNIWMKKCFSCHWNPVEPKIWKIVKNPKKKLANDEEIVCPWINGWIAFRSDLIRQMNLAIDSRKTMLVLGIFFSSDFVVHIYRYVM